jgi:hypothetical protein
VRDRRTVAEERLIREEAGSYRSDDGRFHVEHAGAWYVRDGGQLDELGQPQVLGPFGSLTEARAAIGPARERKVVALPKRPRPR